MGENHVLEENVQGENLKETYAAMLVVCAVGKEIEKYKIRESIIIGSKVENMSVDVMVDLADAQVFRGEIRKVKESYIYRDISKDGNVRYNGKLLGSEEMEGEDSVTLHEGDVLSLYDVEDAEKPQVILIFHRLYTEEVVWKTMTVDDTKKHFYISRHEEIKSGEEVQPADVAEIPDHYAELFEEEGNWYIRDHNTRLGVYLNNRKMVDKTILKEMDVARIGNTLFLLKEGRLYYNHKDLSSNALVIHIEERSVWNLFRKKILLEDINLKITPGEMVLILGGSGAGKTTFINAVMGYEKATGEILAGDINVYKNYNMMKYEIGFVPQQDLLRMEDGVYDTLDNAAQMKMPKKTTEEERKARIDQVMQTFGLEREAESLVSKLSGGQRKRLSIAVEYIADPSLFFLDEPDSGLDGVMARSLMENLRSIADENKMVLVITHSPDRVSDLFNKVIVLAKSQKDGAGHLAFYGGIDEAKEFFDTDSLEGIVKRINREDEGGDGEADFYISKYEEIEKK